MNKLILIAIISLTTIPTFGQGFYEIEENFKLIKSGKKKVSVFKGSELISFKTIDSTKRIITENTVQPSKFLANNYAPKYDNLLSISHSTVSFYNSKGILDSILLINYTTPLITLDGDNIPAKVDSTIIVYGCKLLDKKILTRNYYSNETGVRKHYRSDHYGYNNDDRLIILIEDDGHTQFNFEYNDEGNISAYYIHKTRVSFEYDERGRKSKDIYVTSTNTYEYDDNSFLITKITTGKNEGVFTFKYE